MDTPRCPDCKVAMKEGWIPDASYLQIAQSHWHKGPPEKSKLYGLDFAADRVRRRGFPIQAWRCPDCGLVRTYAFPRKWNKVE